jgi:hypothetical protein
MEEINKKTDRKSKYILVSLTLLKNVLDNLYELRGERGWWKDELRCNYQKRYKILDEEITELEDVLKGE